MTARHCLAIYVEPTPYILGLLRELKLAAGRPLRTIFLAENVSQAWRLSIDDADARVLPSSLTQAAAEIWRAVRQRPGVVHLAGWGHPLLLFALFVAAVHRIPVTMESDTQMPFDAPPWKRAIKAALYPALFRIPVVMLPGGERQAALFRRYGVPEQRIRIAQMTVDVRGIQERCVQLGQDGRRATRAKIGAREDDVVFVFVGRLVPHKGVADLLQAFGSLSRLVPGARLLVVGDGPEAQRVQGAAASNASIHWTGRLDADGVAEMMHAADVAVVPSHFEPWGLVVNEAMACGLPVIVTDRVGAVDSLVIDQKTGLVFPAGDAEALATAMCILATDPVLRSRLAKDAYVLIGRWTLEASARITSSAWGDVYRPR